MVKLYKQISGELFYWETWDNDETSAIIHWGKVGERGEHIQVASKLAQDELFKMKGDEYKPLDEDKIVYIEVQYAVDGFGTEADLNKRHRLESELNQLLGWTGLGHCDGGSIGSGTMEIGCEVVDFEIAKNVIARQLANTEFADYSGIYKLSED